MTFKPHARKSFSTSLKRRMPQAKTIQLIPKMTRMMTSFTDMRRLGISDILTGALWI